MVSRIDRCLRKHGFSREESKKENKKCVALTEKVLKDRCHEDVRVVAGSSSKQGGVAQVVMCEKGKQIQKVDKVKWNIKNSDFKLYYESHNDLLEDFERYQVCIYLYFTSLYKK